MFKKGSINNFASDSDLDPLPAKVILNPLDKFPTRKDTITKAYFGCEVSKHAKKIDGKSQWLHIDEIKPTFGIKDSSSSGLLRRNYRRIASSGLFTQPGEVSLSEIVSPSVAGGGKKYVLVEEEKLAELTKFENILREEKQKLGEQCVIARGGMNMPVMCPANIPVPATRMAVHSMCEGEMKKYSHEITKLQAAWTLFSKQNHYNKPHLFLKESYLDSAPSSQRAMKLKLVKEAAESWRLRKDRHTMQYEDDLSYFAGLYIQAQIRKRDYDRYYVLASRYGVWSEERFLADQRPGKRYWMIVSMGALKFQRVWDRYWSIRKLQRYRAARAIQRIWRGSTVYKKLHPLIRLRLRVGKRSTYKYYFMNWIDYNRRVRRIQELIYSKLIVRRDKCFNAWKNWQVGGKRHKADLIRRFCLRMQNSGIALTLMAWQAYTQRRRKGKLFIKRFLQCPHFEMWVEYTKFSKHMKKLNKAARMMQSLFRGFKVRKVYRRMKKALSVLSGFALIISVKKFVQFIRDRVIDEEFVIWKPEELVRIGVKSNEIERRRLVHQQQVLLDKETKAGTAMKKHLKSKNGAVQLAEFCSEIRRGVAVTEGILDKKKPRKQAVYDLARSELLRRAKAIARIQEKHDYTVKHPPFVVCADPACQAVFTTEDQYHTHMTRAPYHMTEGFPQYSRFHLQLKNGRGQDLFRSFLMRTRGIDAAVNCLDCWISLQDWKRTLSSTPHFVNKSINIFETFLVEDCTRPLKIPAEQFNGIGAIIARIQMVKDRELPGYLQPATAHLSAWRYLFGLPGQKYEEWTEERILPADIFQMLEWHCFLAVFDAISRDPTYESSEEFHSFAVLAESEAKFRTATLFDQYKIFRLDEFRHWAVGFKLQETSYLNKAIEVVDVFLAEELLRLLDENIEQGVKEKVFEIQHEEQKKHEEMQLIIDDSLCWAEINIIEEVYEYYVSSLLTTMWSMPEMRKGMLQYSGLLKNSKYKAVSAKALLINMNIRNKSKEDWFDKFMGNAMEKERESLPLLANDAAIRIQRMARGVLGRRLARKEFGNTFLKKFDNTTKKCYYVNIVLGTSSWERPLLFSRLYPNSNW